MSEAQFEDRPRATVREEDGQLILDDPDGLAMARAVSKQNCRATLDMNADRVEYFKNRVIERQLTPEQAVITVINVDDPQGAILAEALMPGHNWQEYRDRGEVPFARGLADRATIQTFLANTDQEAADSLLNNRELAVVVVDHGVAEIFNA